MNYFAHALPFLDDPDFVIGTSLPDWLTVIDRQVRLRADRVANRPADLDPRFHALARGVLQHLRDDARFHETRAFAEASLHLTARVRKALDGEPGFRPTILGHILVELLLDAALIADHPEQLEVYYRTIDEADAERVQAFVNAVAPRSTHRLVWFIPQFAAERFLSDYSKDAKLMVRLGQIMRRLGLAALPQDFITVLGPAREMITERKRQLLDGIPTHHAPGTANGNGKPA